MIYATSAVAQPRHRLTPPYDRALTPLSPRERPGRETTSHADRLAAVRWPRGPLVMPEDEDAYGAWCAAHPWPPLPDLSPERAGAAYASVAANSFRSDLSPSPPGA